MKELKMTKTIEETRGYEATDGTFFKEKEECLKYENSAKCVIGKMYEELKVGRITQYDLFGDGNDDQGIDIVKIDTVDDLEIVNKFITVCWYGNNPQLLGREVIGTTQIIAWNYDADWCFSYGTIDNLLKNIKANYDKCISKEEKEND